SFDEMSSLDSVSVSIFREKLAQVDANNDAVIIDLTGIDFIDSSGLGAIISVANTARGQTRLLLCGIENNVRRVMELTHLDTVLPLCSSITAAIQILQQKKRLSMDSSDSVADNARALEKAA
ncbi:MAG: anti-sigma factor antagonist, partial [Candidatus Electrothrix sp. AR1]|nr:anti-sigma factor antagonist [Candidatus Electrothrix sp. AR1]